MFFFISFIVFAQCLSFSSFLPLFIVLDVFMALLLFRHFSTVSMSNISPQFIFHHVSSVLISNCVHHISSFHLACSSKIMFFCAHSSPLKREVSSFAHNVSSCVGMVGIYNFSSRFIILIIFPFVSMSPSIFICVHQFPLFASCLSSEEHWKAQHHPAPKDSKEQIPKSFRGSKTVGRTHDLSCQRNWFVPTHACVSGMPQTSETSAAHRRPDAHTTASNSPELCDSTCSGFASLPREGAVGAGPWFLEQVGNQHVAAAVLLVPHMLAGSCWIQVHTSSTSCIDSECWQLSYWDA